MKEQKFDRLILPVAVRTDCSWTHQPSTHCLRLSKRCTKEKGLEGDVRGGCGVCLSDPGWYLLS